MEKDILYLFLKILPKLIESAEPIAKRSGILPQAALLLSVAEAFPDFAANNEKYLSQLLRCGFVKLDNQTVTVTGKGAILAKAVKAAVEKCCNSIFTTEEKRIFGDISNRL
ncbi:MAG: hypothetical protein IKD04_05105 [Clostridia bacterium]|nr:hypothetical protein [Clostridia bacterium]